MSTPEKAMPKRGNWFERLPNWGKGAVIVAGAGGAYLLYKRYKTAQASTASTAATTTTPVSCPPGYQDDGSGNCVPSPAGTDGYQVGPGGGGGGGGFGQSILSTLQGIQAELANTPPANNPPPPPPPPAPPPAVQPQDNSTSANTGTNQVNAATTANPVVATTRGTPTATIPGSSPGVVTPQLQEQGVSAVALPFNYVRIFTAPSGTQYYALGSPQEVRAARAGGYSTVGGKNIPGANPKATYVPVGATK